MAGIPVSGTCDPRFAPLRDAFAANFDERGEPGGAIALMVDGRLVADLWGGFRDAARETP
ncbi:MAG: EstA family serine hydrolase, partial [Alphaproteobacteria bacterium HGW-Alphaproteobacteria-12]